MWQEIGQQSVFTQRKQATRVNFGLSTCIPLTNTRTLALGKPDTTVGIPVFDINYVFRGISAGRRITPIILGQRAHGVLLGAVARNGRSACRKRLAQFAPGKYLEIRTQYAWREAGFFLLQKLRNGC